VSAVLLSLVSSCAHLTFRTTVESAVKPCDAGQLSPSEVAAPMGAGSDSYRITLVNHGSRCGLVGVPVVYGETPSGAMVRLALSPVSRDYQRAVAGTRPANLRSGQAAVVVLISGTACSAAGGSGVHRNQYQALSLRIHHRLLRVPANAGPEPWDATVWLPCRPLVSRYAAGPPPRRR